MKYSNLFWGVVLILLGVLFILKNLNIIFFDWSIFLELWPLFLVLWGIAVLPMRNVFKIILSFVVILITVLIISGNPHNYHWHGWHFKELEDEWGWQFRQDDDESMTEEYKQGKENGNNETRSQEFSEPYDENVEFAKIKVEAAIGDFSLTGSTEELMEFSKHGNLGPYKIISRTQDNFRYLELDLEKNIFRGSDFRNKTNLKLNENPLWDIEIGAGAADIEMDLRPFKIRTLEIDGGASAVQLVLGDQADETRVNIEAAASSIEIKVPENSGCYIDVETFLSSKSFEGFEKTDEGNYQTANYKTAEKKIIINLNAAVADFAIRRY
ncbi:MAG: DUF5668 domain-containing protein [Bacteroidota bacterium]|nr:DUF5668 domain-containing protein [Bacteroidota bacterium]